MLLVCLFEDVLVVEKLLDLGEQGLLLVIVVRLDELKPSQGVADKVGLVRVLNVWGLQVNAVVSSEDGIVQQGHMCCASTKEVRLWCTRQSVLAVSSSFNQDNNACSEW